MKGHCRIEKNSFPVTGDLRYTYIASVLSESETESKQKNQEKRGPLSLLICFQMDTQYKNLKYPI